MKSAIFLAATALFLLDNNNTVLAQSLPSFLSALYGGGLGGTSPSPPSPRPKAPQPPQGPARRPRPRIDRNDDAFGAPVPAVPVPQSIPVNNPQIITATPNSPISNPLQNNYIVQNNNIGPKLGQQLGSAPGGVLNSPSVFASSPNVSKIYLDI